MPTTERILITVRTYPNPSTQYHETVCTGGITDQGEWRRLYPVPLRYLDERQKFHTWDVIKVAVRPSRHDKRPESRSPDLGTIEIVDKLKSWDSKVQWVCPFSFESLEEMKSAGRSLGSVRIGEVLDLEAKPAPAEWDAKRQQKLSQLMLFDRTLPLEPVPFQFRFKWRDLCGAEHNSLVISWEMAETYRQYRERYDNPIDKMKRILLDDYLSSKRNSEFFMGNHSRFRKTFMVCGWFIPPKRMEQSDGRLF